MSRDQATQPGTTRELLGVLASIVGLIVVVIASALTAAWFAEASSLRTRGTVLSKQESIAMAGGGDAWAREFTVSYRYKPDDEASAQTASQAIDLDTYSKLRVGEPVTVRYSPWRLVRWIEGFGSFIEGTPSRVRVIGEQLTPDDWLFLIGFGAAVLLGWIAYRRESAVFAVAAVLSAGVGYPLILLLTAALIMLPLLFWFWYKQRRHGFGVLLLASVLGTVAIIAWRVPHPMPAPGGPLTRGTAVVHRLKTVNHIWETGPNRSSTARRTGTLIRHPFYMLDLELTPPGFSEPVHAVDKIDIASAPLLRQGDSLAVVYPLSDPRSARAASARRDFATPIAREMLELTFGAAALITFVAMPIGYKMMNGFDWLTRAATRGVSPEKLDEVAKSMAALSPDDPRRKEFDEFLRAQRLRAGSRSRRG